MTRKTKENNKKRNTKDEMTLDLDKEIIIGIKTLPEKEAPKKSKNKKRQIEKNEYNKKGKEKNYNTKSKTKTKSKVKPKNNQFKTTKKNTQKNKKQNNNEQEIEFELNLGIEDENIKKKNSKKKKTAKQQELAKKKRKAVFRIVKYTTLVAILIGGGIYFLLSPYFNVTEINVLGNERIPKEEIISLSGITLNENTFKIQGNQVQQNIKQNAYIEKVSVKRKLPNAIEISVQERKPTFMLSFANAYIYLNNQGYMLEISKTELNVPTITGFLTKEEDLHEGNRLCSEDLVRLGQALQIMKSAESNGISNLITKINIENKQDYLLELKSEKKTVHIGDSSNLSTKMLYIISILNENKGIEGEIFVNTDLNSKGAVFRKKI